MISPDTIDLLTQAQAISAAEAAVGAAATGCIGVVALPEKFKLHDIEAMLPARRRQRGNMSTSCIDSYCSYTEAHAELGTTVFVADDMTARTVLNLGDQNNPGHADNLASLVLVKTAAYEAMLQINGKGIAQKDAAEFLEDWSDQLQFFRGTDPEETISRGQAIAAVRKITIDAVRKLESTSENLSESASAFEQVTASSKDPLPALVYFSCIPYEGLQERTFVLRLSILTGDEKPRIVLRIQRLQLHIEEMAAELAKTVHDQLVSESISVVRGTYTRV